jgi:hypothetical protein
MSTPEPIGQFLITGARKPSLTPGNTGEKIHFQSTSDLLNPESVRRREQQSSVEQLSNFSHLNTYKTPSSIQT